jgi:predicted MFS family arabinose efflux permease
LLEPVKQEFGASDTEMGLLTGLAFGLIYAMLGVPVGRLADTRNRRNIVALCCGIWSLATAACGMATQYWHMLLARMSVAVGEAGGMAPSVSIVSDLYPPKMRSFAISLFMMGPNLGTLLGLVIGGMVAQHYGWRSVFLAFGIPGVILALLVYFFVKEPARGAYESIKPAAQAALRANPCFASSGVCWAWRRCAISASPAAWPVLQVMATVSGRRAFSCAFTA